MSLARLSVLQCYNMGHKAKQINIPGSRQHPAEKVALSYRDIHMRASMHLMVYEQYKLIQDY